MGVVYRVTNTALGRIYALKVLAPELALDEAFQRRFKREMRIAASIHHANVVAIHYAGEQDGLLFFVMDYVVGTDLRELLKRSGAFDPARAVALLGQMADALDAAHERGLVHRDVKPANVLMTVHDGQEHAYLTDFGVAKRSETVAGLTAQGAVVGTVDYMAPEQITGSETDARTDVYALGCVFFQMLTGRVPYDRENSIAKLFAHVHEPPPPLGDELAELYPTFGDVIEKAMAKEPADRYVSAGDLALDALAALEGSRYTGPETIVAIGDARPDELSSPTLPPTRPPAPAPAPTPTASQPPQPTPVPPQPASSPPTDLPPVPPATPVAAARAVAPAAPASPARRRRGALLGAGAVAVVAVIAVVAFIVSGGGSSSSTSGSSSGGQPFQAAARPVPTNHVTGTGNATLRLRGNTVTVALDTNGLLSGAPHAMHIHAGGRGTCPPASAARSHNNHQSITTTDGIKFYGPPEAALTLRGDTSPKSIVDFSRYPQVGDIHYSRTFTVPPGVAAAIRDGDAVVVVPASTTTGMGFTTTSSTAASSTTRCRVRRPRRPCVARWRAPRRHRQPPEPAASTRPRYTSTAKPSATTPRGAGCCASWSSRGFDPPIGGDVVLPACHCTERSSLAKDGFMSRATKRPAHHGVLRTAPRSLSRCRRPRRLIRWPSDELCEQYRTRPPLPSQLW